MSRTAITAFAIAPARPDQLPALDDLIDSAFRGERSRAGWTTEADLLGGQRTDLAALTALLADPAAQTLLVAHDAATGTLTGCVLVGLPSPTTLPPSITLPATATQRMPATLGMLTVAPARQGAGLGRQLVSAAEAHARSHGATVMEMRVITQRSALIAWYERQGYADTGRRAPFPYGDSRFGLPLRDDLAFRILAKQL